MPLDLRRHFVFTSIWGIFGTAPCWSCPMWGTQRVARSPRHWATLCRPHPPDHWPAWWPLVWALTSTEHPPQILPQGCCGAESSGARRCLARCSVTNRRRQWHPTPGLLPGKSHGRKSLVGCSPWGCQELDTTERLHFHFSLSRIGEGNLQPTPVFLPGESQRRGSLVGCRLWGRTGSDTTEAT